MTEDEMVGRHDQFNGQEFEQAPGVGDGQGSPACCSTWGCEESDTTEWLNNKLWLHLGLRCSALAFSSCDKRGLLFVAEYGHVGLAAPLHVGSSQTRD